MNETPLTPPHTHINPARLVALVVVAVLSFGVGMYVGVSTGSGGVAVPQTGVNTGSFEEGYESARARLVERGIIPDMASVQTDTISGTVRKSEGRTLVLRVESTDPLSDAYEVTVALDANTQVQRLAQKDPAVYEAEYAEFTDAMNELSTATTEDGAPMGAFPTPPDMFARTPASVGEIAVGQFVTVISGSSAPLSATTRTAQRIEFQSAPEMPESVEPMMIEEIQTTLEEITPDEAEIAY